MGQDIEIALKIQSLDTKIFALRREIASLPKHIAEIEKQLESHERRLELDHANLAANDKERRKLEGEINGFEEKISRLKGQMLEAKTNEQYRAFQHEIGYCEEGISKAEDRIIELMEESEPLTEAASKAEAALKAEKTEVAEESEKVRRRTAIDEKELRTHLAERQEMAAKLSPPVLITYEHLLKKYGCRVLAEATSGKCSACNIALRPQYFQELRHATEPMRCESCGRLLYYHPPVDVEAEQSG